MTQTLSELSSHQLLRELSRVSNKLHFMTISQTILKLNKNKTLRQILTFEYCQSLILSDEQYLGQFTEFFNAKEADTRK